MIQDDIIVFGDYNWKVLDVKDDKLLIVSEDIIELHWYHREFTGVTWADCALRNYLNNEFYTKFSSNEKSKILAVTNTNLNNQWFRTKGGTDTLDKVFLLSLEEVCTYFGNSAGNLLVKGKQRWLIDDDNNEMRKAKFGSENHWWRLRSPGYYDRTSASVQSNGCVYVRGKGVYGRPKDGGGVRPALWLKT
ncbi:DUF6273 domain-containing protein [Sphingobacterium paludis]|uniref:DUF6273 domain-containing protein n=1 Tax=Sphingobacterium paludis TaxID=1476465 RepID=A0A4R7CXV1_9SPHI|nr:DUF6273 domain-containing protein [Sphingobacterium paludis]TDS13120.1 hypothetical protein B0I21_105254 [Sphingobacterium paludis]